MVSRPVDVGGLGFGLKWDMGWMHDTLQYMSQGPDHRTYQHDTLTFRDALRVQRELRAAALARRGRARQGLAARQDARRRVAAVREPAAAVRVSVRAARQEAAVHGRRARAVDASGTTTPGSTGTCSRTTAHEGVRRVVADLAALYRDRSELHELDAAPEGFEWIDASDRRLERPVVPAPGPVGPPGAVRRELHARARDSGYGIGVPVGGRWNELLNTDAAIYGGSGVGNYAAASRPRTSPMHGRAQLARARRCRRSPASSSRPGTRATSMRLWPGAPVSRSAPRGTGRASNFALFSEHATAVELCLFGGRRARARDSAGSRSASAPTSSGTSTFPTSGPGRATATACTARTRRTRGIGSTRTSCCSTRTRRRSPARSTGPTRVYGYAIGDPDEDLSFDERDSAPQRAEVGRRRHGVHVGRRPAARGPRGTARSSTRST